MGFLGGFFSGFVFGFFCGVEEELFGWFGVLFVLNKFVILLYTSLFPQQGREQGSS